MKVIAFGDSITQGNAIGNEFHNWTDLIAEELGIEVINAGIGGNTTAMGLARMEEDVICKKPDLVIINFGMNDHVMMGDGKNQVEPEAFRNNLILMIQRIKLIPSKILLVTPNYIIEGNSKEYYYSRHCYDWYKKYGGAQVLLDRYIKEIRAIAIEQKIPLLDIRKICENYDKYDFLRSKRNCTDDDGVHPSKVGIGVYAKEIIKWIEENYYD